MAEKKPFNLDIEGIKQLIPHRYPMLMIDRVENIIRGESATGFRTIAETEPAFAGHFPGRPIFPGVYLVEAMAQTAAVIASAEIGFACEGKLVFFAAIRDARFRKPVIPGDCVSMPVKMRHRRGVVWRFSGRAFVRDALVAEATFSAMIVD